MSRLYLIFVLSGIAGLGYQFVWTRLIGLAIGHEYASLLGVIGAFFAGLSLGSWLADRSPFSRMSGALLYSIAETVVAVTSVAAYYLLPSMGRLCAWILGETPAAALQWGVSFALPMLLLLPATAAMGASFPAIERLASTLSPRRRTIAALYACNTFGAVVGVVLSAYFLLPRMGHGNALFVFVAINLVCAAATCLYPRGSRATNSGFAPIDPRYVAMLFCTGFLGLGVEIASVRALAQVFEGTIYSYAAALAVFLLGTAGGAAIYQANESRLSHPRTTGALLLSLAVASQLTVLGLDSARVVYSASRGLFGDDLPGVIAAEATIATLALAIPTLLMGATFSHLTQLVRVHHGSIGSAVAVNTLGAALAPLAFGVWLLPELGIRGALAVIGLGYMALTVLTAKPVWPAYAAALAIAALAPASVAITTLRPGEWLVTRLEGRLATASVIGKGSERHLRVNNRYQMGGTGEEALRIQQRQTHVPMLLHPDPRHVLFLGVASGITTGAATHYPITRIDAVELIPETLSLLPFFEPHNMLVARHPNVRLIAGDARRFVRAARTRYDVIIGDLFHPALDGAGALYTLEHFTAIRSLLSESGIFCQWLPAYQLDDATMRTIVVTFLEAFPQGFAVIADESLGYPAVGLVGGAASLEARTVPPDLGRRLAALGMKGELERSGSFIAGADHLRSYVSDAKVATDDFPRVVYSAPRFAVRRRSVAYGRLDPLLQGTAAEAIRFGGTGALQRHIDGRNLRLRGMIAERDGRRHDAAELYRLSVAVGGDTTLAQTRLTALSAMQK